MAVQDGGESMSPLLPMSVNIRLSFTSGNPALQALFFYNTDESLLQVDNRGRVQGPIPLGDVLELVDTDSLRRACQRDPIIQQYFADVYGADEVPCQGMYPRCAIANTDPIDLPGQQWVGFFWIAPGQGEFFDSDAIYHP